MNELRIYVADLAAYNAGFLHGKWIDATQDVDAIQDEINGILKSSPVEFAEEFAIHDYEGFGRGTIEEYTGIQEIHEIACFLEEHGELGQAVLEHFCGDREEAAKALEESYSGCYKSVADYAEELTEQTGEVPENLAFYIDYERMGRDMELSGDIYSLETAYEEVHIFWSH